METLINMFKGAISVLDKNYTLPWIGQTSILKMSIFIALLAYLCDLVSGLIEGKSND